MATSESERRVDATIARLAARTHVDAFESAIAAAESNLHIEMRAPARDANRPVELARRTIERSVRGYVSWVASQVAAFDRSIVSAVRELGDRVRTVEQTVDRLGVAATRLERSVVTPDGFDNMVAPTREEAMSQAWAGRALEALGHVSGRVLHAEAGTGRMVLALQGNDIDAYGVEPSYAAYEVGTEAGLEIHYGDVIEHLHRVPLGALSGIMLSGCVERLGVPDLVTISRRAGALLESRGRIVICSAAPEYWIRAKSPVGVDLAPGHPLHSATWVELLTREHFDKIVVLEGPRPSFAVLPEEICGAAAINANFEVVRALCDASEWYVVSAERGERV
jgi:hypothetical protein